MKGEKFRWMPWKDFSKQEHPHRIKEIKEPPCKHCVHFNPSIVTDKRGRFDGIVCCTRPEDREMHHDFSCFELKEGAIDQFQDLRDARSVVLWFAACMEKQLKANDYKGGWDDCDIEYLTRRLGEEVAELLTSVSEYQNSTGGNWDEVVEEASDVANFAMMIADKRGENL